MPPATLRVTSQAPPPRCAAAAGPKTEPQITVAEVAVFEADDDAVAAIEVTDAEDPETLLEAVQVAEVLLC